MALSLASIERAAPDQASLKAAAKLVKPARWPTLARQTQGPLVWGEHQGSGSNPYRVIVDVDDLGYKCTCPSRKFPCKHALALMLLAAEGAGRFGAADPPEWVMDWSGRRRRSGGAADKPAFGSKSLAEAQRAADAPEPAPDPAAEAKRAALARRRAEQAERAMVDATRELEQWISDQLRAGLADLQANLQERCRQIAARLVDGKAQALAGRVDELPSRLLALPAPLRAEGLLVELSKLVLLARAFRAEPGAAHLRRQLGAAPPRAELIEDPGAPRISSTWEHLGEQVRTRRDGLVAHATWLMNLRPGEPRFALLLDFFPASAGKRGGAAQSGEQFEGTLVFHPGGRPLRAVIAERGPALETRCPWLPARPDPLSDWTAELAEEPWRLSAPLALPAGRIAEETGGGQWWRSDDGSHALPLAEEAPPLALGSRLDGAAGIWDGWRLTLLAAETRWGRLGLVD